MALALELAVRTRHNLKPEASPCQLILPPLQSITVRTVGMCHPGFRSTCGCRQGHREPLTPEYLLYDHPLSIPNINITYLL